MAMAVDNQQRMGHFGLDSLPYPNTTQFSDPWASSSSTNPSQYMSSSTSSSSSLNHGFDAIAKQQAARANNVSMPYTSIPVSAPSISADMMNTQQRLSNASSYDTGYSSAPSPSAFATTSAPYSSMGYVTAQNPSSYALQHPVTTDRRSSLSVPSGTFLTQPSEIQRLSQNSLTELNKGFAAALQGRENFGDALDAGRGMVAMSQNTPRNLYESRMGRSSSTDYGFPQTHSSNSSVSSNYAPSYFGGSVDSSSVTDFSGNESVDSMPSRTLPRPTGLLQGNVPPAPQSMMMGQFSSKISTSTQKKHKCKVCDKRFTRPSSLQTHMYSHTGEKPFSCEAPGCGRHFSVVSNLRRHRKVHRGEGHPSPEES